MSAEPAAERRRAEPESDADDHIAGGPRDLAVLDQVGDLSATLAQPARRLAASTVAGGLRLTVPDTSYAVHVSSGVGHVSDHGVQINPASPRTIDARSSLGDVTIAPR